jgi:hypothetical protein
VGKGLNYNNDSGRKMPTTKTKNELIKKYNISEEDLYKLSYITNKYSDKSKCFNILKPYKVSVIDNGSLLDAIKNENYHNDQTLIDKYGEVNLESLVPDPGAGWKDFVGLFALGFFMWGMFTFALLVIVSWAIVGSEGLLYPTYFKMAIIGGIIGGAFLSKTDDTIPSTGKSESKEPKEEISNDDLLDKF